MSEREIGQPKRLMSKLQVNGRKTIDQAPAAL